MTARANHVLSIAFLTIIFALPSAAGLGKDARINVDTTALSSWSVDPMLFGRFFEHHGCDVYPGLFEEYVINTSFEPWYRKGEDSPTPLKDTKPWLVFGDVVETSGIAYPWQPYNFDKDNVTCQLAPDAFNSTTSQRIARTSANSDTLVGIQQKLALPDYRTGQFTIAFYAKARQTPQRLVVRLQDHRTGETFASHEFNFSTQWRTCKATLDIGNRRASTKLAGRHGIFDLVLALPEEADVLIDQLTLIPADAVNGIYNPETIQNLKDAKVTVVRWPGGNFASGYHWQDGIGPRDKRPSRPNLAWEGLECNLVGTDEFLQFCNLAGLTPLVCVAFDTATPTEAANWVQYCNGAPDTPFGRLRAQNGHPEPYNVKLWQIGNEVYGSYQIGHTTADDYATRYLPYYDAMKKTDPSISMMAMGRDPGYHTNDDNAWNKSLFQIIGPKMDYLDIHRYVRGVRNPQDLQAWDMTRLAEIYLSYPSQYEVIISSIRNLANSMNLNNLKLAVTEWAQYLTLRNPQLPHSYSQANAVFYAGIMNTFLRNGDFVKISCSHDFSVFVTNRPPWDIPVLPRSIVARLYAEVAPDHVLHTEVACDTFDLDREITQMITLDNIPYIDALALSTSDRSQLALFIINRSVTSDYNLTVNLKGFPHDAAAHSTLFIAADDPMEPQTWANPKVYNLKTSTLPVHAGRLQFTAPPCTLTRILIDSNR